MTAAPPPAATLSSREALLHEPHGAAIATVDLANAAYGPMLRLFGLAWSVPAPHPDKALAVDLGIALMQAITPLG